MMKGIRKNKVERIFRPGQVRFLHNLCFIWLAYIWTVLLFFEFTYSTFLRWFKSTCLSSFFRFAFKHRGILIFILFVLLILISWQGLLRFGFFLFFILIGWKVWHSSRWLVVIAKLLIWKMPCTVVSIKLIFLYPFIVTVIFISNQFIIQAYSWRLLAGSLRAFSFFEFHNQLIGFLAKLLMSVLNLLISGPRRDLFF